MSNENEEKRARQRFIARRGDTPFFWLIVDGERIPLEDLSLEGFSVKAEGLLKGGEPFAFEMRIHDIPDKLRGEAQAINYIVGSPQGLCGCRFLSLTPGVDRLTEWLTVHVIATATVRISVKDAEKIVSGPSLI
ncbi:MAG: PilZ domain-containing protein [Rhodocyclaceae bacterium]